MAFERLRAHGAVVSTVAVLALAGASVVSLVVAEGRLKEFDRDRPSDTAATGTTETGATTETPTPAATTTNPAAGKQGPPAGLLTELFALMNADRAAHDLAPLSWDDRLAVTAQQVSDAMAESETVAPKDLRAILALGYTRAGENVVTTPYAATAVSVEYGWMGSASPRATILDSGSQHVGIGATSSADGRVWISADFGG